MWSSLEDAGALVDGLRPQADVFVLQLLGRAVHGFGDQAAFRHLALRVANNFACRRVQNAGSGASSRGGVAEEEVAALTMQSPPRKSGMISLSM